MLSRVTVNIIRRSVCNNARVLCHLREPLQSDLSLRNGVAEPPRSVQNRCSLYVAKRFKSSRKKATHIRKHSDEDSDDELERDDEEVAPGSKVMKVKVSSLRIDLIIKAGFGMTRTKVEEAFYASKLRLNGNKVLKKSKEVAVEDEIDLILHQSTDNPGLLVVNRIVILSMDPANEGVQIKLSRDKNLLIEDYEDPYLR
ncbi:PREDICTED: uncharacterized protein C6orf203 homolog [Vollenhovia emeryi]|uniref:uncharacterized protein C6orf203 homolog n=1 Tax=Vollenhovia emeryi TaxID=411798 RepID=UPI0005F3F4C7|nr:PREDICTED: uncharacterized protein C6orf203 homolog [Vollenhovia emeryi]